jgi:hypothetical protein
VSVPECAFGKFFTKDAYLVLHSGVDTESAGTRQIVSHIHYWLGAEAEMDKNFVAAFQAVQLANALTHGGKVSQSREFEGKESDKFYQYFVELVTSKGGDAAEAIQHLDGGTESALTEVDFYQPPRLYNITVCMSAIMNEVACAKSSLEDDCCYILNSGQGCLYVWRGKKAPHFIRGAALELSFRMRQDQKGWEADEGCGIFKVEVIPISQGQEPELFWEYLEDDQVAEEEIAAALKRAAALGGPSTPTDGAIRRKSTRRASIAPELCGRRTSRQSIVIQMHQDSSPQQVSKMRKNSRRASIIHSPLCSPDKKRNNSAEEEFTAQGTAVGGGADATLSPEQIRALTAPVASESPPPMQRKGSTLTSVLESNGEEEEEEEEEEEVAKMTEAMPPTRKRGSSMSRLFGGASPEDTHDVSARSPSAGSPSPVPPTASPVLGQKKTPSPASKTRALASSPSIVSSGGDTPDDVPPTRLRSLSKGWMRVKAAVKTKEIAALQLKRRPSMLMNQTDMARKLSNPAISDLSFRLHQTCQTSPTVQQGGDSSDSSESSDSSDSPVAACESAGEIAGDYANWNNPDGEEGGGGGEEEEADEEEEDEDYWDEAADPTSGKTYYFHVGTGETSWMMPEGYVKPYHTSDEEEEEGLDVAPEDVPELQKMQSAPAALEVQNVSSSSAAAPATAAEPPSAAAGVGAGAEAGSGVSAASAASSPPPARRPTMRIRKQPNWHLYRVSDDDIAVSHKGMPNRSLLSAGKVFVLDCQTELFVWVGAGASKTEEMTGLALAERLLEGAGLGDDSTTVAADGGSRPEWVEPQVVNYGSEPFTFRSKFAEWGKTENVPLPASWKAAREQMEKKQVMQRKGEMRRPSMVARGEASKMANLVAALKKTGADTATDLSKNAKASGAGGAGGASGGVASKRSSSGDGGASQRGRRKSVQRRRSIDLKVAEAGAFDDDGTGELQVWHLSGSELVPLPEDEYGHFSAQLSYVILYGFVEALDADDKDNFGGEVVNSTGMAAGKASPDADIRDALSGLKAEDGKKVRFICYFWGGRRAGGTDWMNWRMEAMPE